MLVFKKWNMHLDMLNIHIPIGAILKPRLLVHVLVIQKHLAFKWNTTWYNVNTPSNYIQHFVLVLPL